MASLDKLSHEEKVFLAGCIKSMILSDGTISETELSDLDALSDIEGFYDFDDCLAEFEDKIKFDDDFFNLAKGITNPETRDIIIKFLDELSLQDGFPGTEEKIFLNKLVKTWE